jgi:phosphatidylserine decarboxylase
MSSVFVLLQYLLPQHLISRITAKLAQGRFLKNQFIRAFVRRYRVDLSESRIEDIRQFENFNAFFTRQLKPGLRPLAGDIDAVLCPADGAISQLGHISNNNLLQAKGRLFSLPALLGGDAQMATLFQEGCFATVYLSPRDYHRVHMPLAGRLLKMIYIPGDLFSVNRVTAKSVANLFSRNERVVCLFQTEVGPMALVLVGAMIVAGIETVWSGQVCPSAGSRTIRLSDFTDNSPAIEFVSGVEMGRFKLGSTVIALFAHGAMNLNSELAADSPVRMGQLLGRINDSSKKDNL